MGPGLIPRPLAVAFATIIVLVWGASQLAPVFVPTYTPPSEIHIALMAVLGSVFALTRKDEKPRADPPTKPPPDTDTAPELEPAAPLPPGRESAADMIARLQRERGG